jgi:hypothetical protein
MSLFFFLAIAGSRIGGRRRKNTGACVERNADSFSNADCSKNRTAQIDFQLC